MTASVRLRPMERDDLRFVHQLNNNRQVMAYWFEEPYEAYVELQQLYDKHIHDQSERRFIAENNLGESIGLVELVEITHIHRRAEFQIIIDPAHQGKGYARPVMAKAVDYAFKMLNIHKLYLLVDVDNYKAVQLYRDYGFIEEGVLVQEYFSNGSYRDAIRMYMLQADYLRDIAASG
ncbi:spermidine N1-acetyltransferase [Ferrimonas senticii]|uniref:spermidine N1-acetyltransferase n=1 Tax=Ferrimonas senticii TaxID=394566 RepID=UPI0004023F81|nr:spermidine N1-acetyltransferase [Ferrimonas senticii]